MSAAGPWAWLAAAALAPTAAIDPEALGATPAARAVAAASRALEEKRPAAAAQALADVATPAAALVRARIARRAGAPTAPALAAAAADPALAGWVDLELGLAAAADGRPAAAIGRLWPLAQAGGAVAAQALPTLMPLWAEHDPGGFLARLLVLASLLPPGDGAVRAAFLAAQADAWQRLGAAELAAARRQQIFFEEPSQAPAEGPVGALTAAPELWLGRLEGLLAANRAAQVLTEAETLPGLPWRGPPACRLALLRGQAARRLRRYAAAEAALAEAGACPAGPWSRPAAYLRLRVQVLATGLQALPAIEAYVGARPGDPFVDDALMWAGDLLQRRGRPAAADAMYARIEALAEADDYCAEARFRRGWLARRAGDLAAAEAHFGRLLAADGCVGEPHDRARARYWLASVIEARGGAGAAGRAAAQLRLLWREDPLSYHAQLALPRLLELLPEGERLALSGRLLLPLARAPAPLRAGPLAGQAALGRALALLERGLGPEAALELGPLAAAVAAPAAAGDPAEAREASLLWARLMDRAGARGAAHLHLRTVFAAALRTLPGPAEVSLWQAAYPLAFGQQIGRAEVEAGLPRFLLQALCREESAFDPRVVSWAGAVGLAQLMPASARDIAGRLGERRAPLNDEALTEPDLNLRLGAALLASMLARVGGHEALGLVSYNAGGTLARTLWRQARGARLDVFVEDIPVAETRAYVKRVLRTFGIYRWLWAEALPTLPTKLDLPR